MASTLEIQLQLNKLLDEASEKVEKMNGQYGKQTKLVDSLNSAIKKMNDMLDKVSNGTSASKLAESFGEVKVEATEAGSSIQSAMQKASEKINSSSVETKGLAGNFGDTAKEMTKMSAGTAVIGGIGKAVSYVAQSAMAALQAIKGIGGGVFEIAKSIFAFPFKLLEGLISMASVGGSNELAQELEEIRKQFGYLNKTAGSAIIDLAKNMKGELANTGLSVWRTFGNLVERLKYFREYAQKLGETVDAVFRNLTASQAEALGAFNKGLGFTDEGLKGVGQRSLATGESLNEINRQVGNFSIQLSKAFGVSMKLVSRDVGNMIADFEHFGHISVKEMTQASVFARRLGIEVKSLGKLVDKYLNFEDAANSAAQLSQAFGLNVDAFQLMKEQDPAKKLEMLRKAFFETGKTVKNMTIQERRLLAQQTGLGDSEIDLAFAQKNRALSYADIQKKGDAARKSQLTQEQVLNKLAGAIERLVKSGSAMQGGFFDRFLQGFVSGIKMTKEFRELMRNLARSLNMTFFAGRQVGIMFEELFPGVKDFFGGLRDMFNPRIMKSFLNKVTGAFRDFFREMTTDPAVALPKLLDRLQAAFTDRFNAAGSGAAKVFNGIKSFFKALGYIFLSGIKEALLGLGKVVAPLITSIFSTDTFTKAGKTVKEDVGGLGATISKMFTDVFGAPGSETRTKLKASLSKFGDAIWEAFKFIGIGLIEKLPGIFESISDAFSAGAAGAANLNNGQASSSTNKLAERYANAMEKIIPQIKKISTSLITIIFESITAAITSPITWKMIGRSFLNGMKLSFYDLPKYLMFDLPKQLAKPIADAFEALDRIVIKAIRGFGSYLKTKITEIFEYVFGGGAINTIKDGFAKSLNAVTNTAISFISFFSDLFNKGPSKALDTLKEKIVNVFSQFAPAINSLINRIPARVRSFMGITELRVPTPPPSQNPGVQTIQQIERQSAQSSPVIQKNLTNAVNPPNLNSTPSIFGSIADNSISERVTSIRDSISSATEIGRIDQAKAEQAFNKLNQFVETLGPVLRNSETQINKALAGVDISGMSSKIDSVKEIFQAISSIKRFATKNSEALNVSQMMPTINSIGALNEFINSPLLSRLERNLSSAENTARITGIKNTSDSIKEMVDTINQTSRTLARLKPIKIQTNLKRLAANLGLGNNETYTIRNDNFQITTNLSVHIDAKELEKMLVERPDTRIRHT